MKASESECRSMAVCALLPRSGILALGQEFDLDSRPSGAKGAASRRGHAPRQKKIPVLEMVLP